LNSLLPSIISRWDPRLRRLNIKSYYETLIEHPIVIGDFRALEQVFVNLISNAVQAMDKTGGSLSIKIQVPEIQSDPNDYEIIVADSGPGIPDDIREHIFEPFMTTNQNGTGLGLAISKRIISAHKGNIFVESFPGGTMFHVLLPKSKGEDK
ncbi:MAG: ATP-binding protein, partial [Anaerolineaceae bacterium]|nr:ATP-binding protein [Anaerolineaceae bacterium]